MVPIRPPAASAQRLPVATATLFLLVLVSFCAVPLVALAPIAANAAEENVRVRLATSAGDIVLELDARRAPGTVENFLRYVEDGYYEGTIFHRVIEGFMIQGGGFTADFDKKSTRQPIRNEANNGLSNRRHTIAMARTNAPHSASAQFFINVADNDNLDHTAATPRGWGYAVFGRVVEGEDVVEAISRVATGAGGPFRSDAPREPIVIEAAGRLASPDDAETGDAPNAATDENAPSGTAAPETPTGDAPNDGDAATR